MQEIDTDKVFQQLKKQHGEKFAQVIRGDRDHGRDLCAVPNIVHVLEFSGTDENEAKELRQILLERYGPKLKSQHFVNKNPLQLLDEAGYDAFVVKNEEQKNSIKKYYRPGEEICTFNDPYRHKKYYMIHAIKRGADKIKPSNNPERQDAYGTSVISIQIAKPNGGFLSIKNRYNHTVNDPDATFNNNPDNIIPGLTNSLKKYFNVDFNTINLPLPNNFRMVNDQLVRFNYEMNNFYFSDDYYFSGSNITKIDKGNQLLFYPDFVLNISKGNNSIVSIANQRKPTAESLTEFIRDKKVAISGKDKNKTISVDGNPFIELEDGKITFIHAPNVKFLDLFDSVLHGDLDFSGVEDLDLQYSDLSKVTSIKFNPNAKKIYLSYAKGLHGDLDFSGVEDLDLQYSDLSKVTSIRFNPDAKNITFKYTKIILHGDLDFSGVENLELYHVDFSKVTSVKFNPNAKKIKLLNAKHLYLHGDLDFSGVELLDLSVSDLSKATNIKFNPDAEIIFLSYAKGLHGDLDFSRVRKLYLDYADLSKVTSIKFNRTGIINGISSTDWLRLEKNNLDTKENEPEVPKKDRIKSGNDKLLDKINKIKDKLTGMVTKSSQGNDDASMG